MMTEGRGYLWVDDKYFLKGTKWNGRKQAGLVRDSSLGSGCSVWCDLG